MQAQIVIVHGTLGYPEENWFPWLARALRERGYDVGVPLLPTPADQSLETWMDAFWEQIAAVNDRTILIGHSLGAVFVLRLLEQIAEPICATYCVSGFIRPLGVERFDALNRTFLDHPFAWERIRRSSKLFRVYHGDDDPYVPVKLARELARQLRVRVELIEGGGHLNAEAGFAEFDLLLRRVVIDLNTDEE